MSNAEAIDKTTPIAERARQFAPVVWLLGKVQSGKTSIIRELTQATDAEIGSGFRACTKTARVFDFPAEAPIIRFLDTRGLGEVAYDPSEDIAFCEGRSHLILAVVKALDCRAAGGARRHARGAGRRHPDWPVVVAQTSLHEAYPPGAGHVLPYPFGSDGACGRGALPDRCCARSRISARCSRPFPAGRAALRADRLHASRRRLRARRLRPRGPDRGADRRGTGGRGDRACRAAARARRQRAAQAQRPHPGLRAWRRAPAMPFRWPASSPCRWCRRPCSGSWPSSTACTGTSGPTREFAGALGAGTLVRVASTLRRAPARQADPRLRPDGRCRRRGGGELRRHLRHGQGRHATSWRGARQGRQTEEVASVYRAALQRGLHLGEGARHRRRLRRERKP